jgi:ribonuclease E
MPESQMLINYVPGEECRVAIVEDGKLEELYVERFAQASRVGNIYVGRVVNVEPAIQAAFVDFGCGENGFLHVTDLHPRYFPGEDDETTERVGFKTPRRERPPIQAALRRGDEVIVQVLKEGVGTKGPTVTSYLSIPGRFLVMMPQMDKVGVSRKVEDEDQRRQMREILDQLELPEGFGFILRTAGLSRTKAELKRDLAYLQRLWKDMDRRLRTGGKPRLLYSESDLLVRSLRDMLTNEVGEVVIDNELALRRASRFMKIVAPRGTTKLLHFPDKTPMFHAFGIERQIALIHAREVPLPSGGRLVIDQTEALVAIDVNSGKSRDSRDAETNAYQTNVEAVDEICRQLRLRDMGGIVINDLIDMRESRHRKDIENRFKERLKRDRAKTTVLQISEFGILEMTRQRMRPSHESMHFTDCPTCRGRGMLQRPDSVAADSLRDMAAILDVERVSKVEMVVAPRVASELLSTKRQLLSRTERTYGKHVDVRVSETVPVDRVSFYAYDQQAADIDTGNLPQPRKPKNLIVWEEPGGEEWAMSPEEEVASLPPEPEPQADEEDVHPIEIDEGPLTDDRTGEQRIPAAGAAEDDRSGRRKRRRRGGRGRADGRPEGREPRREEPAQGGPRDGRSRDGRRDARPPQPPRQGYQGRGRPPASPPVAAPAAGPVSGPVNMGDDAEWGDAPIVKPITPADDVHDEGPIDAPAPDGQPGPEQPMEIGPDGEPRRRRRRRRGRGRGRARGEGAPAGGPPHGEQGGEAPVDDRGPAQDSFEPPEEAGDAGFDGPAPVLNGEAPHDDGAPRLDENGEPRQGGRRRKRRRGRGGRGGNGNGGAANGGGEGQGQRAGPQQGAPQGGPRQGNPPREGGRGGAPAPQPRPQPAPQPAPAKPRPRTLYGAVRRKLGASELNRKAKPE